MAKKKGKTKIAKEDKTKRPTKKSTPKRKGRTRKKTARKKKEGPSSLSDLSADIEEIQVFKDIIYISEIGIINQDLDGDVTLWSSVAETIFGYQEKEVLGKKIMIVPDDLQDEHNELLERAKKGEIISHIETQRLHKDGYIVDVDLTLHPLRSNGGKVIGICNIINSTIIWKIYRF